MGLHRHTGSHHRLTHIMATEPLFVIINAGIMWTVSWNMHRGTQQCFLPVYPTLCDKGISISLKIRALPASLWSLNFADFSAFIPTHIKHRSVVNLVTVDWVGFPKQNLWGYLDFNWPNAISVAQPTVSQQRRESHPNWRIQYVVSYPMHVYLFNKSDKGHDKTHTSYTKQTMSTVECKSTAVW